MSGSVSFEYLSNVINRPAMSAQNISGASISLASAGTPVPLPSHTYMDRFAPNAANTQFTVPETGIYMILYNIEVTATLLVNSGIFKNGVAIPTLSRVPGVATDSFTCSNIMLLNNGDTLQVTLFGLSGTAKLRNGVGAYLNIARIS